MNLLNLFTCKGTYMIDWVGRVRQCVCPVYMRDTHTHYITHTHVYVWDTHTHYVPISHIHIPVRKRALSRIHILSPSFARKYVCGKKRMCVWETVCVCVHTLSSAREREGRHVCVHTRRREKVCICVCALIACKWECRCALIYIHDVFLAHGMSTLIRARYEKRPTYMKEIYTYEKRPIHKKETNTHEKRQIRTKHGL